MTLGSLRFRTLAPLALALGATGATPAKAPPPPPSLKQVAAAVDAYTRPLAARGDLSGQLLIRRGDRILVERSFGEADRELQVPVTPDTRFDIASVTKPMTAVLAIQLAEDRRLGVGDSLARWLPGFPAADSITVGMLLRHRSGIPHQVVPDSEMTRPYTAAEVAARAAKLPLDFPPGTESRYSSGGYEVLARVLELASGQSYADLLATRLLDPLGMTRTAEADSRRLLPGRARAYVPGPHGMENAPLHDFSALAGAGSVWSTARDLDRFVQAVVRGRLGDGVRLSFVRGGRLDFNGRGGGFKAWAVWDSTTGVEAVLTSNVSTGAPDALKRDIPALMAGRSAAPPAPPEVSATAPPPAELARWEGVYQIPDGPRLELRLHDGALYSNDWVLLPLPGGGFYSPRDYGTVRGTAGPDGSISRLDWSEGGTVFHAPRTGS